MCREQMSIQLLERWGGGERNDVPAWQYECVGIRIPDLAPLLCNSDLYPDLSYCRPKHLQKGLTFPYKPFKKNVKVQKNNKVPVQKTLNEI